MNDLRQVFVQREHINNLIDEYVNENKIEIKSNDIYINGESMGRAGFAAAMRFCYLMLTSDDAEKIRLAVNMLEEVTMHEDGFAAVTFCRILKNYKDRISGKAEERMMKLLSDMRDMHVSEYFDFQGVNDNFPLMAVYYGMIYGAVTNDEELLRVTDERFEDLKRLIKRRGTLTEYCSPSYTPLQLSVLASLVNDAVCEKYREIALATELRTWADYIAHFNPCTGMLSGPFSRYYTATATAENPSSELFFNTLINPEVKIDYGKITDQQGSYMVFATLYYLSFSYHLTPELEKLLKNREYPFRYESTSEFSPSNDDGPLNTIIRNKSEENDFYEYQGGEAQQHFYMTPNYSIGTATREFHNGIQTDSLFVSYRRNDNPKNLSDVRNVFTRYITNDNGIGESFITDCGRKTAIQKDNCAVVLYKPKLMRKWKNNIEYEISEISSLRLCIFIHKKFSMPDKIILGDKTLEGFCGVSEKAESIYIKDGNVFMALHPLSLDNMGRQHAVEVKEEGEYIIISLYNYFGVNKKFRERELLHIRNGFACEISSQEECESFEKFIEGAKEHKITDEYKQTPHTRQTYMRKVVFEKENLSLSIEYSPASEGIKHIACNDRIITAEKMKMTGFDEKLLPYM